MATTRQWIMDRTWQCKNLSTLVTGKPCSNQRTASPRSFDHQRAKTHATDKTVALWKQRFLRMCAERKFADKCTLPSYLVCEIEVCGWIDAVDTMTEKGNRWCSSLERATMRRRVDALGKSADNAKATMAEMTCELERVTGAAASRIATADDCNGRHVQNAGITIDIQLGRRTRDLLEEFRIILVAASDKMVERVL